MFVTGVQTCALPIWFLIVGGVVRVACQGFLVGEACVGVLVDGAVFLLSGVQSRVLSPNTRGGLTPFKPLSGLQDIPVRLETFHIQ